jgi:hypothetical protein
LDIVKHFPSIDHAILLDILAREHHDERVMDLAARIIAGVGASGCTEPEKSFRSSSAIETEICSIAKFIAKTPVAQCCAPTLVKPLPRVSREEAPVSGASPALPVLAPGHFRVKPKKNLASSFCIVVCLLSVGEFKRLPKNSYSANQPVMCRGWLVLG